MSIDNHAVHVATDAASSTFGNIKDGAKHLIEQGQEKAGQARDAIVDVGSNLLANARSGISSSPLIAVGVAFGIGYVAMRIFRR